MCLRTHVAVLAVGAFMTGCRAPQTTPNALLSRPFIVLDTVSDSPGTNVETRIVTFTAQVSGAPPLIQQWEVNKGKGFVPVSFSATNSVLVIGNAQLSDNGFYALFATNAFGVTNTTPVRLVVVEGRD